MKLLTMLDHPNIVKCYGHFWNDDQNILYIVLEFCDNGDLHHKLIRHRHGHVYLSESYIWSLFHQLALGLKHLHENGVVHRDIKSLNIMLSKNGAVAKLADLGVSRQLCDDAEMLSTMYGTPLYLSPELVESQSYNTKTDIWSLGVVLYELCSLRHPFNGPSLLAVGEAIRGGIFDPIPCHYSKQLQKFVRWILKVCHVI